MLTTYWVYIIASRSGVLYTGVTSDLERRISQHQEGTVRGFASKYQCTRLLHMEHFDSILDAIACEKKIKGWRRSRKVALINEHNPEWADLTGRQRSSSYHAERLQQFAHNLERTDDDSEAVGWALAWTEVTARYAVFTHRRRDFGRGPSTPLANASLRSG